MLDSMGFGLHQALIFLRMLAPQILEIDALNPQGLGRASRATAIARVAQLAKPETLHLGVMDLKSHI